MIIQMESIKPPKRVIKKQLKNVNKAIIEIAKIKFVFCSYSYIVYLSSFNK